MNEIRSRLLHAMWLDAQSILSADVDAPEAIARLLSRKGNAMPAAIGGDAGRCASAVSVRMNGGIGGQPR